MNIIFYRYGSIYEPDMISAFEKAGLNVIEITPAIINKDITTLDIMKEVESCIIKYSPLFVYGINFYPTIAEICHIYKIMYISQTVDSPIMTLFSDSILYETNRILLFDKAQYKYFHPYNSDYIYHLPLASATERFDKVIATIDEKDRQRFHSDISFVGSTYKEKDPLASLSSLDDYTKGYIEGLVNSCIKLFGYYPAKDSLNDRIISAVKTAAGNDFPIMEKKICDMDSYAISHEYIGSHIAVVERRETLNALAEHFHVDLYTQSDTSELKNVHVHGPVGTLDEMPKVFNLSKINLNITMRSIESGLPLRCFDILGCGGFLMTNYQPELEDLFVIGKDLEAYSSIDELIDKCSYYLSHENERAAIARSGYEKVYSAHTHLHRLKEMLSKVI